VGLFRRAKPLHEQLAEQGELEIGTEADGEPVPRTPSRFSGLMHVLADGFLSAPPDEFGRPSPFGEVAPLSAIVVPRRIEGDESVLDLRPLPRGQAALALLHQAATPAVDATELVGMIGALVAGVPCWSLAYGSSARAADRLMRPLGG